jgi:hypothetical protein
VTTLPLLVAAEVIVHRRIRPLVPEFVGRDLIAVEDRPRFDELVDRALRLRNSIVAELALLLVSFTAGYWLWRSFASLHVATWYLVPVDGSMRLTEAGYWLAFVSLPISRFLLLRWYFRLFIWYSLLWRVSRLGLRLNALHADRAGGLGFLGESVTAFIPVLVAQSAYFAMLIGNQIWHAGARLSDFAHGVGAVVVFLMLVVLLPLTFFARQLIDARLRDSRRYGQLASRYSNEFDEKWLTAGVKQREPLLGTSDIQSLSDLANSYEVAHATRVVPFEKTTLVRLAVFIALPFLPLTFTLVPVDKLLAALVNIFV